MSRRQGKRRKRAQGSPALALWKGGRSTGQNRSAETPWSPAAARRSAVGRVRSTINALVFLVSVTAIAVALAYFAHRPDLRVSIDATKTRAYSLSDQTHELLASLDDKWLIALLLVEDNVGGAELKQLDEVLRRYTHASDNIEVMRIDPTNPETLDQYEELLGRLRLIYAGQIEQYDEALDRGEQAFSDLLLFAQQQSRQLQQLMIALRDSEVDLRDFQQRVALFSLLAESGDQVLAEVRKARAVTDAQPIADYETARSILAEALSQWANQLAEMAAQYDRWAQQSNLDPKLRDFAGSAAADYVDRAQQLADAGEPLRQLPPMELATIGRQLSTGEAAVVIGPDRAAVIPSQQLLPQVTRGGALTFDRRFRGEQLISSTIRSLLVPQMPMVVFVHNEPNSLLRRQQKQEDLLGVASLLDVSRFDVREWIVSEAERPEPAPQQKAVWIVLPPSARSSLSISRRERELLDATERLMAEGKPVLLNLYPSLLPGFNQPDPWARMASTAGVDAQTDHVVFERVDLGGEDDQPVVSKWQTIEEFYGDSPICRAVHGQQLALPLPVPLQPKPDDSPGATYTTIASVDGSSNRWLEEDWAVDATKLDPPTRADRLFEPQPVILAVTRPQPDGRGTQRLMIVGSGAWLMSYVADKATALGGGRMALTNPGNQELLLASVAWLADMDELIAPSAVSQQVARLDGVTRSVWLRWFLITAVGAPVGCLVLAGVVFAVRRI